MSSALKKSGGTPEWRRIRALVLDAEPVCHWCGARPSTEADHLISRARGGDDRLDNLVGSCRPCNLARGKGPAYHERKPW